MSGSLLITMAEAQQLADSRETVRLGFLLGGVTGSLRLCKVGTLCLVSDAMLVCSNALQLHQVARTVTKSSNTA